MSKKNKRALSVFTMSVLLSANASAWAGNKTLKECAELLPKGHQFQFSISGTVDTRGDDVDFKGRMNLSDGTNEPNKQMEKAVGPYVKCVSRLIK